MRAPLSRMLTLLLCFAVALLSAPLSALLSDAHAEEGRELDEASKKVKAQMEKVLELMRLNEEALIRISTGGRDKPRAVDVEVPDVPPADGDSGSDSGSDVTRALEEIIRSQRGASGKIPGELEELVRLVPQ